MRKNIKKLAAVGLTAVLGAGLLAGHQPQHHPAGL